MMIRRLGALAFAAWLAATPARADPHTVEELLRARVVRDVSLSPDGKRLAVAGKFGDARDVIAVIDIDRMDEPDGVHKFVIGKEGWHWPLWVMWANDRRLLVGLRVGFDAPHLVAGRQVEAIDPDGSHPVEMFAGTPLGARYGLDLSQLVDLVPSDPDHVIMAAWNRDSNDLFRVDVNSGTAELIARGRYGTIGWETEGGRPALRYDINRRGTVVSIHGRTGDAEDDWSPIAKIRREEVGSEWEYAGDAPGIGEILVRMRRDGSDTQNIYRYDLRSKTTGEIVAQTPGFDMDSAIAIGGEFAGASYVADVTTYLLNDSVLQKHWDGIRRYFKDRANVRIVEIDRAHTEMLIHVVGPQSPGDYYLYDLAKANLRFVTSDMPWLDPERLATVEVLDSPMRDGTHITSYLTRPAGATGSLPLVVMPHGGPERRDYVTYDPIAQSFAAQGWLVLQPNFRGSSGYGLAFAEAGHRQWSKRMQDDVTDAVNDLVRQEIADPRRIAIYGASYGGYAALMGAIVTPRLYRAAVSVAGVSDPLEFIDYVRSEDGSDAESTLYWIKAIGDPKADRAAIEAISPRHRAAEVAVPVLLMHGSADDIVPAKQSRAMQKALEKAGKPVSYFEFDGEGHSGWSTRNEIAQVEKAIAFLKPLLQ